MIGIFGGTFDPVHHGHLRVALDFAETLALDTVRLVPCRQPPHRSMPAAGTGDRLEMLRRALRDEDGLSIDVRELERPGPSYMVDTLASLREEAQDVPLVLLLGMDAFEQFDQWHQWRRIIELAHIAVGGRPGSQLAADGPLGEFCRQYRIADDQPLAGPSGQIIFCPVTQLESRRDVHRAFCYRMRYLTIYGRTTCIMNEMDRSGCCRQNR